FELLNTLQTVILLRGYIGLRASAPTGGSGSELSLVTTASGPEVVRDHGQVGRGATSLKGKK
ncbi:MAG: hypothetical protein WB543_07000, partial [Candidatus Acidiferrum sp.]